MRRLSRIFSPDGKAQARMLTLVAAMLVLLVAACGSPEPTATSSALTAGTPVTEPTPSERTFDQEWEELITAAQEEGLVTIAAGGAPSREYGAIFRAFTKKFGVKVIVGRGSGLEVANRMLAEQSAGRYAVDIGMISVRSSLTTLLPAGALVPVDPWLIHPEVVDTSLWFGGQHWYADEERKYVFLYSASVGAAISQIWYNSNMLGADDLADIQAEGYQGFLDPKWKGRMASQVPSAGGGGLSSWLTAYWDPQRGPEWVERMITEMDMAFSDNRTVISDWVARGRYPITINSSVNTQLEALQALGGPVARTDVDTGLVDISASSSAAVMLVMKNPPRPNAARLYLNWYLSKEGQTLVHETVESLSRQSLREDIPYGNLLEVDRRLPDVQYTFPEGDPGYQEAFDRDTQIIMDIYQRYVQSR